MSDQFTDLTIVAPAVAGIIWAVTEFIGLSKVRLIGPPGNLQKNLLDSGDANISSLRSMKNIAKLISDGSNAFLVQEYKYLSVFIVLFSIIIKYVVNTPTMIAFIVGALTSCLCGFIGMRTAVYANVRTTHEAWTSLGRGFFVALRGGSVMGFSLVSLGVLGLFALIYFYRQPWAFGNDPHSSQVLYEAIAGYGLGGSSIALFARVGGGIYTKAADVGADLSGKNSFGMDEDDPRNPACIADNVGDNVGDVAGMGADLFGSFAESTCAALVIASSSVLKNSYTSMMYPVMLTSSGILVGMVTMIIINIFYKVRHNQDVEKTLKAVLTISTVLQTPTVIFMSWMALPGDQFRIDALHAECTWWKCAISVIIGLWSGLIIGFTTEYYTSHSYRPVREIAETQKVSAATGIIYGLALGYLSCIAPVICLGITICVGHQLAGMYGVALGALGMLGTLTMGLTIDAYGPISDNAGGIAEMSNLGEHVRVRTDVLDAAGNTTAAIGKGFAIGSAALVSLALFAAFTVRAHIDVVDILDQWAFLGLLLGAMLPYAFSAMTMKSVGHAANDMVEECLRQFPKIISGEMQPDYKRCISISTDASLKAMIAPGCLVIFSPIIAGMLFGKNCTAGLLVGALVSGVQMAISMSNSGGAWDNAKKYIESGGLGPNYRKGSEAHKNSVTGDTVGDPLKDTCGPSLNILVKLSAIVSLVFANIIKEYSNPTGGPFWL